MAWPVPLVKICLAVKAGFYLYVAVCLHSASIVHETPPVGPCCTPPLSKTLTESIACARSGSTLLSGRCRSPVEHGHWDERAAAWAETASRDRAVRARPWLEQANTHFASPIIFVKTYIKSPTKIEMDIYLRALSGKPIILQFQFYLEEQPTKT